MHCSTDIALFVHLVSEIWRNWVYSKTNSLNMVVSIRNSGDHFMKVNPLTAIQHEGLLFISFYGH